MKSENLSAMDMIIHAAIACSMEQLTGGPSGKLVGPIPIDLSPPPPKARKSSADPSKQKRVEDFKLELSSDLCLQKDLYSATQIVRVLLIKANLDLLVKEDPMALLNEASVDGVTVSQSLPLVN